MPSPVLAEMGQMMVSPPHSSGTRPYSVSCCMIRSGLALGLIHLVDGHDDGDLGGLGVVDGLHGLGHDAVVGGHHQDGDIGDHGAPGPHGGEGLVAGGCPGR